MPDIQTLKTPAGTPAWLVEDHNIPFVALELRFVGGTAIEPMEKRGVTQFMMGLLEEGSGAWNAMGSLALGVRYPGSSVRGIGPERLATLPGVEIADHGSGLPDQPLRVLR